MEVAAVREIDAASGCAEHGLGLGDSGEFAGSEIADWVAVFVN
jgi:hypothetical protein